MTDLVLLRDLIRDTTSRGHSDNVDLLFRKLRFGSLFECVITRAVYPYPPVAIALSLDLLGVKSITTCARAAPDLHLFAKWYAARLNIVPRFDLSRTKYKPFSNALDRFCALSTRNQTTVDIPTRTNVADLVTRPCALIRSDYNTSLSLSTAPYNAKRSRRGEQVS